MVRKTCRPDGVHAGDHFAKDRVQSIEVGCRYKCEEKLTPVGTGATVGHAQQAGPIVNNLGVELTVKLIARGTRSAANRAPALGHETLYDPMEL